VVLFFFFLQVFDLGKMESLSSQRQEMVNALMAAADIEDIGLAREVLQNNGWQLGVSVNAYMMMIGEDGGAGSMMGDFSSSPLEALHAAPPAAPASSDPAPAQPAVQRLVDDMPGVEGPAYENFRNFAADDDAVFSPSPSPPTLHPPPPFSSHSHSHPHSPCCSLS
jgi:hypothetical protein